MKKLLGAAGSAQYVEFILQYDRESWSRVLFERPTAGTWYLRSFMRPDEIVAARAIRGRLEPGLVPVAYDHYGNYVCIRTSDPPGCVEFWDHETEETETLARDLRTFIEALARPPSMEPWDLGNPAFGAIRTGNAESLASYLNCGGDANATQSGGFPSLAETAAMHGQTEMIEMLHARGASLHRALRAAAKNGNLETVEFLLQRCPEDVNVVYDGETPLIAAATWGHLEIVDALLSAGADPGVEGKRGRASDLARRRFPELADRIEASAAQRRTK